MRKLFIQPDHGKMGEIVKKLKEESYEVTIIGWGYPPMYVLADEEKHKEIKEMIKPDIDEKAEFVLYRADLVNKDQMFDVFAEFSLSEIEQVCVRTGDKFSRLRDEALGNVSSIANKLIAEHERLGTQTKLVDAIYKTNEVLFLKVINSNQ